MVDFVSNLVIILVVTLILGLLYGPGRHFLKRVLKKHWFSEYKEVNAIESIQKGKYSKSANDAKSIILLPSKGMLAFISLIFIGCPFFMGYLLFSGDNVVWGDFLTSGILLLIIFGGFIFGVYYILRDGPAIEISKGSFGIKPYLFYLFNKNFGRISLASIKKVELNMKITNIQALAHSYKVTIIGKKKIVFGLDLYKPSDILRVISFFKTNNSLKSKTIEGKKTLF